MFITDGLIYKPPQPLNIKHENLNLFLHPIFRFKTLKCEIYQNVPRTYRFIYLTSYYSRKNTFSLNFGKDFNVKRRFPPKGESGGTMSSKPCNFQQYHLKMTDR